MAMVHPRRIPRSEIAPSNFVEALIQDLFYLAGNFEMIANLLLLSPIFLILLKMSGREKSGISLFVCVFLSAGAEILQSSIPGRVSSPTDFALNSLGAFFTYLLFKANPKFFFKT